MADSRITSVTDSARGCGWRKVGGYYLMGNGTGFDCGRLPIPFATCPCCGFGIRPSRQPTWVDGDQLLMALRGQSECEYGESVCETCPLNRIMGGDAELGEALLVWIGQRHYPTINHFEREAQQMGISRRVQAVPNDFEVGETWVMLAHPQGIPSEPKMGEEVEWEPAIFHIFKPDRIEYVCSGKESKDEIDSLIERDLTPVIVERDETTPKTSELWDQQD